MSLNDAAARQSWPAFDPDCLGSAGDARIRLASLSTIAAILVNELSRPLSAAGNVLDACATELRDQPAAEEGALAKVDGFVAELAKAEEVLQRMRSFIASGRLIGRREALEALIDAAGAGQRGSDGSTVEIVKSIPDDAGQVLVDRNLIEQVLARVIAFCCETPDGKAIRRINVEAVRKDDNVLVWIQDKGPALSDYDFIHLFEPLFTAKPPGPELGMPICKTIVEAHGGRMWAERPPGGGTAFGLWLPAAD